MMIQPPANLTRRRTSSLGNPTSIERANGVDTSHVFDSLERLVELDHDAPLGSLDARTFAYDGLDRRTDEVGPEGAHEFDYDSLSQLVATVRPGGYPFDSTTFTLDADGNRTAAGGTTYVPNSLDQYASVGGTSYTYDSAGNLTDDGTFAYGYDAENRLTSVSGTALIAAYGYDALGRRIRKTVNGTTTLYVHGGDQILEELNAAEVVQATFVYGLGLDEPLTMQRSSQTSWYLRDPIGTVTALTDALGAVAESYRYDAFGELAMFDASGSPIAASALQNPFLFAGRELDGETGVYHYRARAYSPVLGRFLQRDPLGQLPDVNVYRYVGNHPLDMIDPYGLFEERTHWTEWIPFDDYIFSPGVANFSAGMGDGISRRMLFGYNLTGNIRNAIGAKGVVNECSGAYFAGDLAAEAWERITFRGRGKGGPDVSLGARSRRAAPRGPGGPHTPDQRALKDLVEDVTNNGTKPLSREDAETVLDWAREVGYPGVRASAGDLASPSNWTANPVPHIHLPGTGRHGHVPVLPGVRPR